MGAAGDTLERLLDCASGRRGRVVVLTGPGIIEESGVPSMRGGDAIWRVGNRIFDPVEMATLMTFRRMPGDVWGWYLYRRACGRRAEPNAAHLAIARLEQRLGDRFLLATENIHGLHQRGGASRARTHELHGSIDLVRCAAGCHPEVLPLPDDFALNWERDRPVSERERPVLTCRRCAGWLRPHVLWFDEPPDEARYRSDTALDAAANAALLLSVGTSRAPSLPTRMCKAAVLAQAPIIVVDTEPGPLAELAAASPVGYSLLGAARWLVPGLCDAIARKLAPATAA